MKKQIFFLLFGLMALVGSAQPVCQAYFYTSQDSTTLYMYDMSMVDSSTVTVVSWQWTLTGMGLNNTYSTQNPTEALSNLPDGAYSLCLTIITATTFTSTYCDSIFIGIDPNDSLPCINYVDMDIYHVTVAGGNDGAIDLTVNGGSAPYQYSWTNGATTEDIYGLSSGVYTAVVWSADSMCTPYTVTGNILEPYDSSNLVVDTLYINAIDSCLGFVPDSFYVGSISTSGNIVTVVWIFTGAGQTATITVDYTFTNYGSQIVVLSIDCNSLKTMSTYMSYIYIHSAVGLDEAIPMLNVYPNPASNQITLPEGELYTSLRVIGMDGSVLLDLNNPGGKVDISSIPEGIYIIMGESSSGITSGRLNIIR